MCTIARVDLTLINFWEEFWNFHKVSSCQLVPVNRTINVIFEMGTCRRDGNKRPVDLLGRLKVTASLR